MSFISQGDFMFPFEFVFYWMKHFYIWSYQTGAANPDGVIRLPGRIFNFLVFGATNHIVIGYFYAFFSLFIIFVSFYVFATHFLDIKQRSVKLLGALFFTINPVFLGYLAKVGLMVGVAMLPLCLVVLQQAFIKKQFRYFILYILLLNISLIHPFTFIVNAVVSGCYLLWLISKNSRFLYKNKLKVLGVLALGFMLNAYFVLPIASLGTVSKTVLSEEISDVPVDYAALVDYANARDPLTAFSLSKDVFLDFEYFNFKYEPLYFVAAFVFYVLILGLYVRLEKQLSKRQRARLVLLFSLFIVLLLLSMTTFFGFSAFIKFMIDMPGGWAFRSPLKWQLYIPLVLSTVLCLLLHYTPEKKIRRPAMSLALASIVVMAGFLSLDIGRKLLVPKQFTQLGALHQQDMDKKNMLFVNDNDCFVFLQNNPRIVTELNQVLISKNMQLKRVKAANMGMLNLDSFDYVFGCHSTLTFPMQKETAFEKKLSFANGVLDFYENTSPKPYMYTTATMQGLSDPQNLSAKSQFTKSTQPSFDFATDFGDAPIHGLQDPFETILISDVQDEKIVTRTWPLQKGKQSLQWVGAGEEPFYYSLEPDRITLSAKPRDGFKQLSNEPTELTEFDSKGIEFAFVDEARERQNLIPNASLEEGLWKPKVWDCYAYDEKPAVAMALNEKEAPDGKKSLELSAKLHIACTGPPQINVKTTSRYLLRFMYRSPNRSAGYQLNFDDPAKTVLSDQLPTNDDKWHEFTKVVEIPEGAKKLQLLVHGQQGSGGEEGKALYDDFKLLEIPDLQGKVFLTSDPEAQGEAPQVDFQTVDPTKKLVRIKGARSGFFLNMRDTFHSGWQLHGGHTRSLVPQYVQTTDKNHLKTNGYMNSWYIDPATYCQDRQGCSKAADGTYNIDLSIEFGPQRWFYAGLALSMIGFIGVAGYFVALGVKYKARGGKRNWTWQ